MNKFDKHMILTYALEGMKVAKEELKNEFRDKYEAEDTDYLLDEINNLNNLIQELQGSIEREDTELV